MSPTNTLIIYGVHAALACLTHAPTQVLEVWIRGDARNPELERVSAQAAQHRIQVQRASTVTLDKLAGQMPHQGVVLRRRAPAPLALEEFLERGFKVPAEALVIVLDQIQDPHNLGAALRLADAVGADAVVVTKDRAVAVTSAVAKVASGALDTVPLVAVTNLARALAQLKAAGLWVVGATHDAPESLYALDLQRPLAWVIGGEGQGLRRLTRESCDLLCRLPMRGQVASLNLGTAAAVCLYETLRQRGIR